MEDEEKWLDLAVIHRNRFTGRYFGVTLAYPRPWSVVPNYNLRSSMVASCRFACLQLRSHNPLKGEPAQYYRAYCSHLAVPQNVTTHK